MELNVKNHHIYVTLTGKGKRNIKKTWIQRIK